MVFYTGPATFFLVRKKVNQKRTLRQPSCLRLKKSGTTLTRLIFFAHFFSLSNKREKKQKRKEGF